MKKPKAVLRSQAELYIEPFDFVRYMRAQGHSFSTIACDVRMWFTDEPDRRITGPELREWYERQAPRK
jgi:hypothetical protein